MQKVHVASEHDAWRAGTKTATASCTARNPPLAKPIVIPSICIPDSTYHPIGLPFTRVYPPCLASYDISANTFLAFIDQLNIMLHGHMQAARNVQKAGKTIHAVGHFDPTGITKLVGAGVQLTGQLGAWASIEGPQSRKTGFLQTANDTLFHPRDLHVEMIDTKELRKRLGLDKSKPLMAPLNPRWIVPSKEQMLKGQRCRPRSPHRILLTLIDRVQDLVLMTEGNPLSSARIADSDYPVDEATKKLLRSKNAQEVRNTLVGTEMTMELGRHEALALLRSANAITGSSPNEVKQKKKLLEQSHKKDRETHATAKMKWLLITSLEH